jgi:acyl dehydratase
VTAAENTTAETATAESQTGESQQAAPAAQDEVTYAGVQAGAEVAPVTYPVNRLSLVKYCGASGDFNFIHWNERIAKSVGLPDVIAHGMFTMAQAGRYVTDWAGPRAVLVEFGVRFSSPVVVPDDDTGATIEVSGLIEEKLDDNRVMLALTARAAGTKVLTRARAVVRLP